MVTIVSQAIGQGQDEEAAEALNRTIVSSTGYLFLMGFLVAFVLLLFGWAGVSTDVIEISSIYCLITFPGMFCWMYFDSFR